MTCSSSSTTAPSPWWRWPRASRPKRWSWCRPAAADVDLGPVTPHRTHRLVLDGNMATYRWTINGRTMHGGAPLKVRDGERVRLVSHAADCGWH
jgi:FtsP/CotA-like multicopper oxidase with cupredoxin domain